MAQPTSNITSKDLDELTAGVYNKLNISLKGDVGSNNAEEYYNLFHEAYILYPMELYPGVTISRQNWADAFLPHDSIKATEKLKNGLLYHCQYDEVLKSHLTANAVNFISGKCTKFLQPYSFRNEWDVGQQATLSQVINPINVPNNHPTFAEKYPEIAQIRERRKSGMEFKDIFRRVYHKEIVKAKQAYQVSPTNITAIAACFRATIRRSTFFIYIEQLKEKGANFDVSQVVQIVMQKVGMNIDNYRYVDGYTFSKERYSSAFRIETIEQTSFVLFKKHLVYYYINIPGQRFESFEKICPVLQLAILRCSKFLSNERTRKAANPSSFILRHFDINDSQCNVFPSAQEYAKIVKYVTEEALKLQEEYAALEDNLQNHAEVHDIIGDTTFLSFLTANNTKTPEEQFDEIIRDLYDTSEKFILSKNNPISNQVDSTSNFNLQSDKNFAVPSTSTAVFLPPVQPPPPSIEDTPIPIDVWNKARTDFQIHKSIIKLVLFLREKTFGADIYKTVGGRHIPEKNDEDFKPKLKLRKNQAESEKHPKTEKVPDLIEAARRIVVEFRGPVGWDGEVMPSFIRTLLSTKAVQDKKRKKADEEEGKKKFLQKASK